jgi:hypothetical protein
MGLSDCESQYRDSFTKQTWNNVHVVIIGCNLSERSLVSLYIKTIRLADAFPSYKAIIHFICYKKVGVKTVHHQNKVERNNARLLLSFRIGVRRKE